MSSQIYDHLCVWKFPLNSKLLGDKDCIHWIWPVKKDGSFSFYLSIAVLLVFLYLIAAYASVRQCVIIIYHAHKISLKYIFPAKIFIEICCQKCQKCNPICVTTFFYWISRVCQKKKIKYIHQNLRYYETIQQIHLMVVKK